MKRSDYPAFRARKWFEANPGKTLTSADMREMFGIDREQVARMIWRLRHAEVIESDHHLGHVPVNYRLRDALADQPSLMTDGQLAVFEFVAAQPQGVKVGAVAAKLGLTADHIAAVLRALRKKGFVARTRHGQSSVWATPARCDHIKKRDAELARRRSEYAAAAQQRRRAEEVAAAAWLTPSRQVVPATQAPPIRTRAVNSVFALGA